MKFKKEEEIEIIEKMVGVIETPRNLDYLVMSHWGSDILASIIINGRWTNLLISKKHAKMVIGISISTPRQMDSWVFEEYKAIDCRVEKSYYNRVLTIYNEHYLPLKNKKEETKRRNLLSSTKKLFGL